MRNNALVDGPYSPWVQCKTLWFETTAIIKHCEFYRHSVLKGISIAIIIFDASKDLRTMEQKSFQTEEQNHPLLIIKHASASIVITSLRRHWDASVECVGVRWDASSLAILVVLLLPIQKSAPFIINIHANIYRHI